MSVTPFPSENMTPRQALLWAEKEADNMEQVAIVYMIEGENHPKLTVSSMQPVDMMFLGTALQHYSMRDFG